MVGRYEDDGANRKVRTTTRKKTNMEFKIWNSTSPFKNVSKYIIILRENKHGSYTHTHIYIIQFNYKCKY